MIIIDELNAGELNRQAEEKDWAGAMPFLNALFRAFEEVGADPVTGLPPLSKSDWCGVSEGESKGSNSNP